MNALITPSRLKGVITAPASKSFTHRALICASLAEGESIIKNWLISDDTLATLEALKKMGAKIKHDGNNLLIKGSNGRFNLPDKKVVLNLHDSGTSLRFLTAVSSLSDGEVIITGSKSLSERPLSKLITVLKSIGIKIKSKNGLPLSILGSKIKGGNITIDSEESSQYASALLLTAPFCEKPLSIKAVNLSSSPYIDITCYVMKKYGVEIEKENDIFRIPKSQYKSAILTIEGDYSSASYFLAAKYILKNNIKIKNLNKKSIQGDSIIISLLKFLKNGKSRVIDMNKYPDLVPIVAVMSSFVNGKTKIVNISHLSFKESDRIRSVRDGLSKMGIKTVTDNSTLIIYGGTPHGAEIESYNDHRIAMSFAIAALNAKGNSIIKNYKVASKSYPKFWDDLENLGAKIRFLN